MKRSEMIKKINKAFKKSDYDAESVLDLIEGLGMLPPAMDFYFEKECSKEELDYSIYDFRFEWEPEDE
jgi:hypothetical protein